MADQMQYGAAHGIFSLILSFAFFLTVGTAFATLGGMLGALFFKKDQPPVAPPPPVPPFNPTPFNPPPVQ
jgi:hypothetical protein